MESSRPVNGLLTRLSVAEFLAASRTELTDWSVVTENVAPLLVVDLVGGEYAGESPLVMPVCPVVGVQLAGRGQALFSSEAKPPGFVDLVVDSEEQLQAVVAVVAKNPHAAAVFVQLLRNIEGVSVERGLFAESLAYSTLQHGAEFRRWLSERAQNAENKEAQHAVLQFADAAVLVSRDANRLQVQLNRPARRNAFSADIRDLLCEALELACLDERIEQIHLSGAGAAFCAGGDLAEFGVARDASRAHLSRTTRSAGALLHQLRQRVRVEVHGACIGAGIELPAFADHIDAHADSFFQLPEVSLGLVPGAGGCVSLPRRIGRHRTAFMALSGARIDAPQALEWGLIDNIVGSDQPSVN